MTRKTKPVVKITFQDRASHKRALRVFLKEHTIYEVISDFDGCGISVWNRIKVILKRNKNWPVVVVQQIDENRYILCTNHEDRSVIDYLVQLLDAEIAK